MADPSPPPLTSVDAVRAVAFDDELSVHERGQVVVVGCGNLLRGDDAVGPIAIRHLWDRGVPDGVVIVDGGTAGMDVAFKMRAARLVLLIDASATGAEPGTIYRVPGSEIEQLPALEGLHSHQFRWDHALAFGHWLLGEEYPDEVEVFLIEAAQVEPGSDLSEPVETSMHQVLDLVEARIAEILDSSDTVVPGDTVLSDDTVLPGDAATDAVIDEGDRP